MKKFYHSSTGLAVLVGAYILTMSGFAALLTQTGMNAVAVLPSLVLAGVGIRLFAEVVDRVSSAIDLAVNQAMQRAMLTETN